MRHGIQLHRELVLEVELARAELRARESAVQKHILEHVGLFSLSRHMKALLRNRVSDNVRFENLCCETGKDWLVDNGFDPIWVEIINEWAYEALSCKGYDSAEYNLKKLEKGFETNFGFNQSNQSDGHESNEETQPMKKNVIERVSELEAALRKRSPEHDSQCATIPRYENNVVVEGVCTCGHDDAMKVLGDDLISVTIKDGQYRFYQTRDGAICADLEGSHFATFSRTGGAVIELMRELLCARDKLINLQGHAR